MAYRISFYNEIPDPIWFNFCIVCKNWYAYPTFLGPFVKKKKKKPLNLNCICVFVKLSIGYTYWIYFWALFHVLLIYISILTPIPHCFDYGHIMVRLPTLFFFSFVLAILGSFDFMNLWISLLVYAKYLPGILKEIALNLYIKLGSIDILII